MKNKHTAKIINIKEKTRYKLLFLEGFYRQRFNEINSTKKKSMMRELDIVDRLLHGEAVTGVEYQKIMTRINKTVGDEDTFNAYMRGIRNA